MSSLMKGTAILTIGLFLSKILGLIYIFPFYAIVGKENIGLYQYAYIPYNIMLSIAISGLPVAISKFVAKYNAKGDYETGRRLLKQSIGLMIVTGIVSFLLLNFLATPLAKIVISSDEQIYTVEDVATVIRWVSFALLVVPIMSSLRGFLQGNGEFLPTSISQLVEQIVRIIVLLGAAFLIVIVFKGDIKMALNMSVFSAFIGGLAGLYVMYYFWKKHKPALDEKLATSIPSGEYSTLSIYKELFTYSIPVVFVGLGSSLFQLVDMITFNNTMISIGLAAVTDDFFTMLNFTTQKIIMIPVMLATGFSMALIPTITKYFTEGDKVGLRNALDKTYQVLLFLTIPATFGITVLSDEIYHVLYEQSAAGGSVLAHYAPVAILFALFSVTAAILQGIDYQRWIIFSLLTGLLVKLLLNIPLIKWLEVDGAILATALGYVTTIIINIVVIHKALDYKSEMVKRRIILICILTVAMIVAVYISKFVLGFMFEPDTRLRAIMYCIVGVGVGAGVYGFISLRLGLAQKLLGAKVTKIANKLGFK